MEEFQKVLEVMRAKVEQSKPLDGKLKMVVKGYPVVVIDGTSGINQLIQEDISADCEIHIAPETIKEIREGKLSPMKAILRRKIRIKGDMSMALQLKNFLS
ncbi:MAG: SCP2 sterol-binding domain-containing protein [Flavobacteriaceae bacterium]|nr:SCP2 sterol-binding domain-containing protein [Flavobacteriaceae bacterium]MCY4216012.1 SCP2 sterol-binding domain-containing protein [Flavobacteriaceae bacterium]MCY4266906.1 SCP2 sterol-binding domain-containing protein [Flavobacteriaceae bacterium]